MSPERSLARTFRQPLLTLIRHHALSGVGTIPLPVLRYGRRSMLSWSQQITLSGMSVGADLWSGRLMENVRR